MKSVTSKLIVLIIASAVASFRRAGEGFTANGKAFPLDYFDATQAHMLLTEPKLSIKEVPFDAMPEGVDTSLVDALIAEAAEADPADAPGQKTQAGESKEATLPKAPIKPSAKAKA